MPTTTQRLRRGTPSITLLYEAAGAPPKQPQHTPAWSGCHRLAPPQGSGTHRRPSSGRTRTLRCPVSQADAVDTQRGTVTTPSAQRCAMLRTSDAGSSPSPTMANAVSSTSWHKSCSSPSSCSRYRLASSSCHSSADAFASFSQMELTVRHATRRAPITFLYATLYRFRSSTARQCAYTQCYDGWCRLHGHAHDR